MTLRSRTHDYPTLFSPIALGKVTIKHRIVSTASMDSPRVKEAGQRLDHRCCEAPPFRGEACRRNRA